LLQRATAALAGLGLPGLLALVFGVMRSRSAAVQLRLVEALGHVARSLQAGGEEDVGLFLMTAGPHAADDSVRAALARLMARSGPVPLLISRN
jgi:hypothetical protein